MTSLTSDLSFCKHPPELIEVKLEPLEIDETNYENAEEEKHRLRRLRKLKRYLKRNNAYDMFKRRYLDQKEKKQDPTFVGKESPPASDDTFDSEVDDKKHFTSSVENSNHKSNNYQQDIAVPEEMVKVFVKTEANCTEDSVDETKGNSGCVCEICGQLFPSMKNMLRHMGRYHKIPGTTLMRGGKTFFKCQYCELEFPARSQLYRHCHQKHPNELKAKSTSNERIGMTSIVQRKVCHLCHIKMKNMEEFISHLEKIHPETFCDICYKVFLDSTFLYLHRRIHFAENPFACDFCPKVFKSLQHVGEHRRGHTGDKPYKCTLCPMGFARIGDLNKHTKHRHTEKPSYMCAVCPETFHSSTKFHRHKQKHQKEVEMGVDGTPFNTFTCEQCGEMFENGNDRKEHVLISHAEGRPHSCPQCGKRFKLSGHLKAHMHTHTGVKSQKCGQCPAAFYLAGDLRRHLKTHQKAEDY